jgi:hypothetical protein
MIPLSDAAGLDEHVQMKGAPRMSFPLEQLAVLSDPTNRRCWLLANALEHATLDQAIDLARKAEDFIAGRDNRSQIAESESHKETAAAAEPSDPLERKPDGRTAASDQTSEQTRLGLAQEQRDKLLGRLAEGATNAELASEFGLSPRQVQGVRLGTGRKGVKNRDRTGKDVRIPIPALTPVEEVIRYLRQQDDVVVRQGEGFLVNGRFQMSESELVSRANRMRARQHRPEFVQPSADQPKGGNIPSANGHPLFWNRSANIEAGSQAA